VLDQNKGRLPPAATNRLQVFGNSCISSNIATHKAQVTNMEWAAAKERSNNWARTYENLLGIQ
jgi:hypothetical protein